MKLEDVWPELKDGLKTVDGCKKQVEMLFFKIANEHDCATAHKLFAPWGKPHTKKQLQQLRLICELVRRLPDSVNNIAKQLAEENEKLPKARRHGTGTTDPDTMRGQIKNLLNSKQLGRLDNFLFELTGDVPLRALIRK
jgi:hypothetical protein